MKIQVSFFRPTHNYQPKVRSIVMIRGIWFYGLSGSGKTHASGLVSTAFENSFIVDGDVVREFVSTDLSYSQEDRKVQIARVLGISKIALNNKMFPIISTVTLSKLILDQCDKLDIDVVEIVRPYDQLAATRTLYTDEVNVVGKDLPLATLPTRKIQNDGTKAFEGSLFSYVDEIKSV